MRLKRLLAATVAVVFLLPVVPASAISLKRIHAVSFSDASTGYMAGGYSPTTGFLSSTTNGGLTWTATAQSNRWFKGVGSSGAGAWAVADLSSDAFNTPGAGGVLTNKGPAIGGVNPSLTDIEVLPNGRIVAVGQRRYETVAGYSVGNLATIASSSNGGATWATHVMGPLYPPTTEDGPWGSTLSGMTAVDALSSGSVAWAVGNEYNSASGDDGSSATLKRWLVYKSTNGGSYWTTQTAQVSADQATNGNPLTGVAAASVNTAFAVGGNRTLLRTTNGGSSWTQIGFTRQFTPAASLYANGVAAVDDNTVVAVGGNGGLDGSALIAVSKNAGAATPTWAYTVLSGVATLRSVEILNATTWIAVGDEEVIYRTTNAGVSWTPICSKLTVPVAALTAPSGTFALSLLPITVRGTAADTGVGVVKTEVRIRRADGKNFNGSAWTSTETWLPAQTTDGWKTWSLVWQPDAVTVATGQIVTLTARASDGVGLQGISGSVSSGAPMSASISLKGGDPYTSQSTVTAALTAPGATHMRYAVNGGASTGWAPFASSTTVNLGTGDGTKAVSFDFSTDGGTTTAATASGSIVLHTSIPLVAISSPAAGFDANAAFTVGGTASDVGGTIAKVEVRLLRSDGYSWNGSAWVTAETWLSATTSNGYANWTRQLSPTPPGKTVSLFARTYDHTGLLGTSAKVDSASPVSASVSLDGGSAFTTSTAVVASLQVGGSPTHMRYQVNGGSFTPWSVFLPNAPVTLTAGDGSKTVTFNFSTDGGSTTSAAASDDIVLHTSYPSVSISSPAAGFLLSSPISITGVASDVGGSVSSVKVRLRRSDGKCWNGSWTSTETWLDATGTSSWSIQINPELSEMISSVTARATDAFGLVTDTEAVSSSAASAALSLAGGAQYTTTSNTTADISSGGSATHMRWSVNGGSYGAWVPYASSATIALGSDGSKTVSLQLSADGVSPFITKIDDIYLDSTAPSVVFLTPPSGDYRTATSTNMVVRATDWGSRISAVRVRIKRDGQYWNGGSWQIGEVFLNTSASSGNWAYSWRPDAETRAGYRPVSFIAVAEDAAGNSRTTSAVTLDPIDPVTLTSSSSRSVTPYKGAAVISGILSGASGPVANEKVEIWYRSYSSGSAWKRASTVRTTDSRGAVSWTVRPKTKTYYEMRHPASGYSYATATARSVTPKVYLSTRPWASRSTIYHGKTYYWYSSLAPRHTKGWRSKMYFQRYYKGKGYRAYKTRYAYTYNYSSYSRVRATYKIPYKGWWRVRTYHNDAGHAATYSSWRYVYVR